jgi:hypothetical protein
MRRWLALLWILGCGDDGGGADGPAVTADARTADAPPVTADCNLELSGAASGDLPCAVTAGKNDEDPTSVFGLQATASGTMVVATVRIQGTLAPGNHLADVTGGAVSVTTSFASYVATKGSEDDIGTIGNLEITSLDPVSSGGGATVWAPHGSFTAILVSPTNPDARVTLLAEF